MTAVPINTTRADPGAIKSAIADLKRLLADRCTTADAICSQHASTLTGLPHQPPDAVAYPETVEDVRAIVAIARSHGMALIPFGAGTSLEGQVNAPRGGLSVDFSGMSRIVRIGSDDLDVTIEPGVTLDQLNSALRDTGLFFPVDPGAGSATLGGMASTRASGTSTVRYGAMRENVLAMKVVLADGTLISTGTRARKSAAGYDLTRLFVGAEGTLGLIVELTLRLHPRPEAVCAGVASFKSLRSAARAAIIAVQSGLTLERIELLDQRMLRIVNAQSGTALPEQGPALFVETAGTLESATQHLERFKQVVEDEQGEWLGEAATEDGRRRLWQGRHDAFWSVRAAYPGKSFLVTDVCVPISRLAECLEETASDLARHALDAPIVGHVGDGNFHTIVAFDPSNVDEEWAVRAYLDRLAHRAIAMHGTCTGEHGIGQGKVAYLFHEAGSGLDIMRQLKVALDPLGLMNPGKIF